MRLFGSITELVSAVFRVGSRQVTVAPTSQSTGNSNITIPDMNNTTQEMVLTTQSQTLTNKTISGASNTISNVSLTTGVTGILPVANGGTNSSTSLNSNRIIVSSAGAIVETAAIGANLALVSNASGLPVASTTTATELTYVHGVTSAIQGQLDGKIATIGTSTNNAIATWNGTGGTALQNTNLTFSTGILQTTTGNLIVTGATTLTLSAGTGDIALATNTAVNVLGTKLALETSTPLEFRAANNTNFIRVSIPSVVGTNRTPQIPDDTGDFVLTSATQTLTNKSIVASQITGQLAIANGGTGQSSASAAFNALSPLTTKGDILVYSSTNTRQPVGSNGQVLTADNGQATGLTWSTVATNSLNQFNVNVGDSSNLAQQTNTNLLGDIAAKYSTSTVTISNGLSALVSWTSHGLSTGDKVYFTSTGSLPSPLTVNTTYWIFKVNANSFQLATSLANAVAASTIDTTTAGSGVHTAFAGGLVRKATGYPGAFDGGGISGGYIGEVKSATPTTTSTVTANTEVAVNSGSITLSPGYWLVAYDSSVNMTNGSTAGLSVTVRVRVLDGSNNNITGSGTGINFTLATASVDTYTTLSKSFYVTLSAATTLTLNITCSRTAGAGANQATFKYRGTTDVLGFTGTNNEGQFYAVRVG